MPANTVNVPRSAVEILRACIPPGRALPSDVFTAILGVVTSLDNPTQPGPRWDVLHPFLANAARRRAEAAPPGVAQLDQMMATGREYFATCGIDIADPLVVATIVTTYLFNAHLCTVGYDQGRLTDHDVDIVASVIYPFAAGVAALAPAEAHQ